MESRLNQKQRHAPEAVESCGCPQMVIQGRSSIIEGAQNSQSSGDRQSLNVTGLSLEVSQSPSEQIAAVAASYH